MTVALRSLLVTAALAAGLAVTAPARAAELGFVSDLNWGISEAEQTRTVADMRELEAKWIRLHVSWKDFEQSKYSLNMWNIAATGAAIDQARAAGAQVILMVHEAPAWASGSTSSNVPRDPADFADFMGRLAMTYKGRVAAYEIWNEQNYRRFWSTGPDPAAYAALLRASYPAIKAADPAATVLFGGLSTNDWQYVEGAYRAGVKGSFDALATHPYPDCGGSPDTIKRGSDGRMTRGTFLAYREIRATMTAFADAKPIWVTEFGWSTATTTCNPGAGIWMGGVTEDVQAAHLRRSFALFAEDPYVQVALVYGYRNLFFSRDADEIEAQFGLVRTDFTRKGAFAALKALGGGTSTPPPVVAPVPPTAPAAPTVALRAPTEGAKYWSELELRADASDDVAVTRVEFRFDGKLLATDTTAPYSYRWKSARHSKTGQHLVSATAYDGQGNETTATARVVRSR